MAEPATIFEPADDTADEQALRHGEAQLDAGQGIPLADVVRWLDSWGTPDELPPPPWK
jgi:predicted transcriptional regulator